MICFDKWEASIQDIRSCVIIWLREKLGVLDETKKEKLFYLEEDKIKLLIRLTL